MLRRAEEDHLNCRSGGGPNHPPTSVMSEKCRKKDIVKKKLSRSLDHSFSSRSYTRRSSVLLVSTIVSYNASSNYWDKSRPRNPSRSLLHV